MDIVADHLRSKVEEAKKEICLLIDSAQEWTPRKVSESLPGLNPNIVSIAVFSMVESGCLTMDDEFFIALA